MTQATAYPYILLVSDKRSGQAMPRHHRAADYDTFMAERTGRWSGNPANAFIDVGDRGGRIQDGVLMPPRDIARH